MGVQMQGVFFPTVYLKSFRLYIIQMHEYFAYTLYITLYCRLSLLTSVS